MTLNKSYTYPLVVLVTVGFIVFSALFVVHKMGLQVNPPQPDVGVEKGLVPYIVWIREGKWAASRKGDFSIFKSTPPLEDEGLLSALLFEDQPEIILLNVKADIGKEKVLSLLKALSESKLKKVYVVSAYDNSLENIRRVEPRFWFSPSPKAWIKWSLLSSFYLHTIYDPKSDFLFIDESVKEILSPKLKTEIARRNLLVIQTDKGNQSFIF